MAKFAVKLKKDLPSSFVFGFKYFKLSVSSSTSTERSPLLCKSVVSTDFLGLSFFL